MPLPVAAVGVAVVVAAARVVAAIGNAPDYPPAAPNSYALPP